MKSFYKTFFFLNFGFLTKKNLQQLQKIERDIFEVFSQIVKNNNGHLENIKSQISQDVFVLHTLNWKRNGFFIEFGATDGVSLSNTFLLEKDFGWKGILAEPAKVWHKSLTSNRLATIDFDCVWSKSGEWIDFTVTPEFERSAISSFINNSAFLFKKNNTNSYSVRTISLNDLLEKHGAPSKIDYLSIDTEGSEFEILKTFNFDKYAISIITCEHNYSSQRSKIYDLLVSHGFVRVFDGLSRWDDWYINLKNISNNNICL